MRSAVELVGQLLKLHVPEDLLCNLPGSFTAVVLNHQLHGSGPAAVLQLAERDGIRLQLQVVLKQQEVLRAQTMQHVEQRQGCVQRF